MKWERIRNNTLGLSRFTKKKFFLIFTATEYCGSMSYPKRQKLFDFF
ncbi:hypothetical protein G436_4661 [Leptospira interrogans serovar Hardjo str. Norma]|uniref:Uncharacterized protein n=1 Tax=Leptospira interrogans serovar Hardjo str. Norma TaxID=1279460 RepID=A0A0M4NDB3_LEPIR|nr:hypothetical protein G436_4661 [Leptospira interrogans serovar Hardjo str. Norma]